MMKAARVTILILLGIFGIAIIIYLVLGVYYNSVFTYGTWINGNYCTGMSVAEASQLLNGDIEMYTLVIHEKNGEDEIIRGNQFGYHVDYTKAVETIKKSQNPINWGLCLFRQNQYKIMPTITYDDEKLEEVLENLDCYQLKKRNESRTIEIRRTTNGCNLIDYKTEEIDASFTTACIKEAINCEDTELSLEDEGCYTAYKRTAAEEAIYRLWRQIEIVQKAEITFKDAALEMKLSGVTASGWLQVNQSGEYVLDNAGKLMFDQEKVQDYVKRMETFFNTKGNSRTWTRKDGKVVTINSRGKGYVVNAIVEVSALQNELLSGVHLIRKPSYSQKGEPREIINLGETYIEIDMSAQKLYYYQDNVLSLSTNIVTGNISRGNGTPAAVCSVYAKQKNRTLHGENYDAFVYYWIPIRGNIGIHDATWRDAFGGNIYKTEGSHGCVNLPKQKAESLYGMVEVGTPVIMYY